MTVIRISTEFLEAVALGPDRSGSGSRRIAGGPPERQAGLLILISCMGTILSAFLWSTVGFSAAATCYVATCASLSLLLAAWIARSEPELPEVTQGHP